MMKKWRKNNFTNNSLLKFVHQNSIFVKWYHLNYYLLPSHSFNTNSKVNLFFQICIGFKWWHGWSKLWLVLYWSHCFQMNENHGKVTQESNVKVFACCCILPYFSDWFATALAVVNSQNYGQKIRVKEDLIRI